VGISEYPKVDYLQELPDEAIDAAVDKAAEARSPFTQLIFGPLGGALSRMDRSAMALNTPDAKWVYFCLATWQDPALAEGEVAWARSFMETLRPWAAGAAPPNFMSPDDGAARLRSYYGEDKFRRLVALKDKYDPDNVIALNQNIAPSVTST
jgi:FAD/FMN-containing dehydrogenase